MAAIMSGWLTKRAVSATIFKTWKDRHITLKDDCVSWRASETESAKGSLPIDSSTTVTSALAALSLSIKHGERELVLRCSSASELIQWRTAIEAAIGNAEQVVSDETCSICLDECTGCACVKTACCSHHFHRECLSRWLKTSPDKSCPLCRSDASSALAAVPACNNARPRPIRNPRARTGGFSVVSDRCSRFGFFFGAILVSTLVHPDGWALWATAGPVAVLSTCAMIAGIGAICGFGERGSERD